MLPTSVDVVVQGLQLHEPPTVWRAVLYFIAVHVISIPVFLLTSSLRRRIAPRNRHIQLPGFQALRRTKFSRMLRWLLPNALLSADYHVAYRNTHKLEDLAGHWDVYALIAVDSAGEELLYRGLPLAMAIWLDATPLIAVLLGTLLWANLHQIDVIPKTYLTGVFYAWLWLSGAWSLAIALHVGINWFGHSLSRAVSWSTYGRYPKRTEVNA